jgi:hypothetical protein
MGLSTFSRDYAVVIRYNRFNVELSLDVNQKRFYDGISNLDVLRYLKGVFTNKERFIERFIEPFRIPARGEDQTIPYDASDFNCEDLLEYMICHYDIVEPFSYEECFRIENQSFQSKVFGSIDIGEMISNLGHKRIKVDGMKVTHKQFGLDGNYLGDSEYDNIYEVHEVDGTKLGLDDEKLYALRCWCTSTNKEHWLWIEDEYKDNPLEAVASTFRIHANLIPYIKEIKRQGDILLVEMNEDIEPEGDIIPLNAEQYFSLLTCQS